MLYGRAQLVNRMTQLQFHTRGYKPSDIGYANLSPFCFWGRSLDVSDLLHAGVQTDKVVWSVACMVKKKDLG